MRALKRDGRYQEIKKGQTGAPKKKGRRFKKGERGVFLRKT